MPVSARRAAYDALEAQRRRGARPDMVLAGTKGLAGRDRALAANLVNGVLQNRMLLDYRLAAVSGRDISELSPEVRDILRLSAYQMLFLDRVPDRAVIFEGVELAKRLAPRASGLVNAVLRRLGEAKDTLPDIEAPDREAYLSIRYSHPEWLVRELAGEYGVETCERILACDNTPAPITAQVNTLRCSVEELESALSAQGVGTERCPILANALYLSKTGPVEELEAFKNGLFYVQDPAARLAVTAASLRPGMRVLDLCAAPGGKSFAAAMDMGGVGEIRAFDIHEKKAALVKKGADRLGVGIISAAAGDAGSFEPELEGWADAVICDVPCSGFGVIRKKPEIRYKEPGELERLPDIQLKILNNAARYVRAGGALLYSTCTLLRRENAGVVEKFLSGNGDFEPEGFALPEPFGRMPGMGTILPHTGGTDGFFICLMRKKM